MDFQSVYHRLHEINWPHYIFIFYSFYFIVYSLHTSHFVPFPGFFVYIFHIFCIYSVQVSFGINAFACDAMSNFVALLNYQKHTLENPNLIVDFVFFFSLAFSTLLNKIDHILLFFAVYFKRCPLFWFGFLFTISFVLFNRNHRTITYAEWERLLTIFLLNWASSSVHGFFWNNKCASKVVYTNHSNQHNFSNSVANV